MSLDPYFQGLTQKEWRKVLDDYLWENKTMTPDQFGALSQVQNFVINEIKKSKKRKIYGFRTTVEQSLHQYPR